jgi:hypothetical protein
MTKSECIACLRFGARHPRRHFPFRIPNSALRIFIMPDSIPDIIVRLARQHLDDVAAKRQAGLFAIPDSIPDGATGLPINPDTNPAPAHESENVTGALHPPDAPNLKVPATEPPAPAPVAVPQLSMADTSPSTVSANATPDLVLVEQLPFPSPTRFDFSAEPGARPAVDERLAPAVVPPDPARRFDSPAPAWDEPAASPHDDSATRLEQLTRDMESSLTRLLTTQIEALTRLRERLEEHERRWIEQAGARRAAM